MVKQEGEDWFNSTQNSVKNHLKSIELGWVLVVFSDSLQFSMIPSHIQRLFVCYNSDNSPNSHFAFSPLWLKQGANPSMGVCIDVRHRYDTHTYTLAPIRSIRSLPHFKNFLRSFQKCFEQLLKTLKAS